MAEVVPEPYRSVAICIDSQQYELTPLQQEEAQRRAASKAKAQATSPVLPGGAALAPRSPVASESKAPIKRPVESVTDKTDCSTWWRLFDESDECFGPYRVVGGGIKPEGYEACNEIPSPLPKCGPRRN